jgi:hypothetical protein
MAVIKLGRPPCRCRFMHGVDSWTGANGTAEARRMFTYDFKGAGRFLSRHRDDWKRFLVSCRTCSVLLEGDVRATRASQEIDNGSFRDDVNTRYLWR